MSSLTEEIAQGQATRLIAELSAVGGIDSAMAQALTEEVLNGQMPNETEAVVDAVYKLGLLTEFQNRRLRKGGLEQLQFGPYLLLDSLPDDQAFGAKYLAVSKKDRKKYAIRLFPLRNLFKHQQTKKALGRLQQAAKIPQLNVLTDVDSANGTHYLAWPYVEGETLEDIVNERGPLESGPAIQFATELLKTLGQAHALGLSHGLLRPGAVLRSTNGSVQLLDFGLGSVWAANLQETSAAVDTVSFASMGATSLDYTAPEQLTNNSLPSEASDLYSLGCTLYFACTGQVPYPQAAAVAKIQGHLSGNAVPPRQENPTLDVHLSDLIEGLMSTQPEMRADSITRWNATLFAPAASTVTSQSLTQAKQELFTVGKARTGSASQSLPFELSIRNGQHGSSGSVSFDLDDIPLTPIPNDAQHSEETPSKSTPSVAAPAITSTPIQPSRKIELQANLPLPVAEAPITPHRVSKKSQLVAVPMPVNLSTGSKPSLSNAMRPVVVMPELPIQHRRPFRTARSLMFWKKQADTVQLSVFGPPEIAPGQRVEFLVYAHLPEAFEGVATLGRALRGDVELLGTGYVDLPVPRNSELGLHLALENAGVAKSLRELEWIGHTSPRNFEVFVPWESPAGVASGVLSAGLKNERVATVTIHFVITPRGV
jgi:serine/threonine protein kinase